jgi:L-ascorbate metabolism protein UlaG (beta-lactamase superfamily)
MKEAAPMKAIFHSCYFALCTAAVLSGQGGSPAPEAGFPASPPTAPAVATIRYLGNSAILIAAADGTRVVCDPYGDNYPAGLAPLPKNLVADVVTVSHKHDDHSNSGAIGGKPLVLTEPGTWQVGMVKITGYPGREGSPGGPSKMSNTIFVLEIGGARLVHFGDSGFVTDPAVLAAVSGADIVVLSIDDYVIRVDKILGYLSGIGARTFIPVHFSLMPDRRWQGTKTLEEYAATLPSGTVVTRLAGEILLRPNMPVQVAAISPLNLAKR